jgi:uncharacterized repeat protein (TIGR02543 family)
MKSFFRKGISILVMLFMAISQFAMYPQVVHAATYTWQSLNGSQSFSDPLGVAKDSQGNMYVTDEGNGNIEELQKSSGTWVNIPGPQGLTDPGSIAVDSSGNLYVAGADSNAKIWELPVGGSWTDITNGATIWNIDGIAVDNSGNVYLTTEQPPDYILKLPKGSSTWVSIEGTNDFTRPYGICTDSIGNVYVADRTSNKVGKLSNGSSTWVDIGTSTDGIDSPTGVAVDSQNNLYVCNSANGSIIEFNGSNWTTINNNAPLASAYGVVLDSNNDIYATAEGNPGLYKWAQVAAPAVTAVSPSSGSTAGGDTVTITGTGFIGATAVNFGSTAATSYTVVSDTEITAISPAGSAGNVDITVTTAGGTSTTGSVDQFTYNTGTSAAAPTVTAVSPSSGTTLGGTTVTITGTGFTGATAVQFGSTAATNYTVDSDTQITATVPAGTAGAVDITVITPNGTSSTSTVDQYTYNAQSTTGSGICFTGDSPQIDSSAQASLHGVSPVTITDGASGNVLQVDDSDQNLELDNAADYGITTPSGMQGNFFLLHDTDSWIKFSVQGGKTFDFNGIQLQDGGGGGTYGFAPNGDTSKIASFTLASNESRNIDLSSNSDFKNVNSVTLLSDGGLSCRFDNISMNIYSTQTAAPTVTAVSPSSGTTAGGTTVAITGTGFTGATAVQFGSTAATNYTVDSDTQITATVPAGTVGNVDITVTAAGGTSTTSSADQYTYSTPSSGSGICFTADSPQINTSIAPTSSYGAQTVTIDDSSGNVLQVDADYPSLTFDNSTQTGMSGNHVKADCDGGISSLKFSVQGGKTFDFKSIQLMDLYGSNNGVYEFLPNGDATKMATFTFNNSESKNIDLSSNADFQNVNYVTLKYQNNNGWFSCNFDNVVLNIDSVAAAPTVAAISPSSGSTAGGDTVTITGTGFTGATAVNFGGTAATNYTVVSDTEITATAPAGTGTVDTTVTTANGTSSTISADKYTYTATVTYDGNTNTGGTAPTDSASYAQNDTVTLLGNTGNLSKSGYSFAGWNTKGDGTGTNYAVGNTFSMGTANVTLYAKWTANTSSGGGGSSSSGGGYIPPSTPTTVTGEVVDDKGDSVKGIPAQVTTDTNGTKTVEVKSQDAILFKQADGTSSTLSDLSKLSFSTPDTTGGGTNAPSVTLKSDGTIQVNNLANGCETNFNVTLDLGNGQTIIIGKMDVKVSQAGDVSLTSTLIDPYGVITDASTGQAIAGADVTLYYADTARNKAAGKTPNTMVQLPSIDGFEPNNNNDPQISDATGAYGWMVFPNADYYIVATKDGYEKYTSPTISVEQEIVKWDFQMTPVNESPVSVSYIEHVQHKGWMDWVSDGQQAGTTGQSLRGEALKINLVNAPEGAHIEYQVHVENKGWMDWVSDGQQAGTTGQYLRLEAIKITLENMPGYSVEYQVHVQDKGWMDWVSDGQQAGTTGQHLRLEAIRIKIVKNSSSD